MLPELKVRIRRFHQFVTFLGGALLVGGGLAAALLLWTESASLPRFFSLFPSGRDSSDFPFELPPPGAARSVPGNTRRVEWRDWGPEAVSEAARDGRLILLHLAPSWSHWTRLMEEVTYADGGVAEWVEGHTVPVRVDPDVRPDVARRYLSGGWPTTALLLPGGEVVSSANFIAPKRFLPWADKIARARRANPGSFEEARGRTLLRAREAGRLLEKAGGGSDRWGGVWARRVVETELNRLSSTFDRTHGGWGKARKFPVPEAHRFLLEHYRKTRDPRSREMLEGALRGARSLIDPVWGGAYRYSMSADWRKPEYEKLLPVQSAAIEDFAALHDISQGEERRSWRDSLERTVQFLRIFLKGPEGFYYFALDADARSKDGGWVEGREYYALGEAQRLARGRPEVDRSVYVGHNARLAAAYLDASRALERGELKTEALALLDRLWERGVGPDGRVRHVLRSGPVLSGLLQDQAAFFAAETAAWKATRDPRHASRMLRLLEFIWKELREEKGGALLFEPSARAGVFKQERPLPDPDGTAAVAILCLDWARESGDAALEKRARVLAGWAAARPEWIDPSRAARLALRKL